MVKRRERMDERQPQAGLGRHDRASHDEPRTARPGVADGARAIGLRGQHAVDAFGPDLAHPERWRPETMAAEGVVRPEDLPSRRADGRDAA